MPDRSPVQRQAQGLVRETRAQARTLATFVGLFWVLEAIDWLVFGGSLDGLGIQPRSVAGLKGIFFAPFLHGSLLHLVSNTVPFVLLGWLTMSRRRMDFWVVTATSAVVGGLGVWLLGASGTHIGSSILVFGYLGFLLGRGVFERSAKAIVLSLFVGWAFGGLLWGIVPYLQSGISWEGHLFGLLGGVLTARSLGKARRTSS